MFSSNIGIMGTERINAKNNSNKLSQPNEGSLVDKFPDAG